METFILKKERYKFSRYCYPIKKWDLGCLIRNWKGCLIAHLQQQFRLTSCFDTFTTECFVVQLCNFSSLSFSHVKRDGNILSQAYSFQYWGGADKVSSSCFIWTRAGWVISFFFFFNIVFFFFFFFKII
jgi:hypothetical protein